MSIGTFIAIMACVLSITICIQGALISNLHDEIIELEYRIKDTQAQLAMQKMKEEKLITEVNQEFTAVCNNIKRGN